MNRRLWFLALLLVFSLPAVLWAQYRYVNMDSNDPLNDHYLRNCFVGNTPMIKVRLYEDGSAYSADTNQWDFLFRYSYGIDDTNGMVTFEGSLSSSNTVQFHGGTNAWPEAFDNYYFSVVATNTNGYVQTWGTGLMDIEYDPASGDPDVLNARTIINWNLFTNQGVLPWVSYGTNYWGGARDFIFGGDVTALTNSVDGATDEIFTLEVEEADALETARTFSMTGDVAASGVTFDGTGDVTLDGQIGSGSVGTAEIEDGSVSTGDVAVAEFDGLYLRLDGTTTPSADIGWGGNSITNVDEVEGTLLRIDLTNGDIYGEDNGWQKIWNSQNGIVSDALGEGELNIHDGTWDYQGSEKIDVSDNTLHGDWTEDGAAVVNQTEADGLYLRLDGTTTPSADIGWGGQSITNLGDLLFGTGASVTNTAAGLYISAPSGTNAEVVIRSGMRAGYNTGDITIEAPFGDGTGGNIYLRSAGGTSAQGGNIVLDVGADSLGSADGAFVVTNDGSDVAARIHGTLLVEDDPTSGDMVGNRSFNDGRYVNELAGADIVPDLIRTYNPGAYTNNNAGIAYYGGLAESTSTSRTEYVEWRTYSTNAQYKGAIFAVAVPATIESLASIVYDIKAGQETNDTLIATFLTGSGAVSTTNAIAALDTAQAVTNDVSSLSITAGDGIYAELYWDGLASTNASNAKYAGVEASWLLID